MKLKEQSFDQSAGQGNVAVPSMHGKQCGIVPFFLISHILN